MKRLIARVHRETFFHKQLLMTLRNTRRHTKSRRVGTSFCAHQNFSGQTSG
jgi:hypothetical protein